MSAIYTARERIHRGAIVVIDGADVRPMNAADPPIEDDQEPLTAAEGMHRGDKCFVIGQRVRRVRV